MVAHTSQVADGLGRRWLMLAAEMAGLAAGTVPRSPDLATAGWACLPRIATCTPGSGAASVRAARDFAVATVRRWGAAERSYDIAIVVSELLTNALRYTRPGSGQARPRRPIRLGLLQLSPGLLCAVADPSTVGSGAAAPGGVRRDRPRAAHRRRAQRPVGLHHERHREGGVGHLHHPGREAVRVLALAPGAQA